MSLITIRPAILDDLETLLVFEQELINAERPLDPFLKDGQIIYYNIPQLISNKNIHLLVAVSENELVGCGYIRIEASRSYHKNPLNGYIGFIYIKPTFRGRKISTSILTSLKDWAKTKNLKELRLDVYSNNDAAIKSYKKFGFKQGLINMKMQINNTNDTTNNTN